MKWLGLLALLAQTGCSLVAASILDSANKDGGPASDAAMDAVPAGDAQAGTENCINGVDDDNDGKADCADPKCQTAGFACVPTATASWTHAAIAPGLACAGGTLPSSMQLDPQHGDSCSCACTPPTASGCAGTVVESKGNDNMCTLGMVNHPGGGGCSTPGIATGGLSNFVKITPPKPADGSCSGGLVDPSIKTTAAAACTSSVLGGGCAAGKACAWTGAAPACVVGVGSMMCPTGYPTAHVAIAGASDGRMCCTTGCTLACKGSLDCFDDSACSMNKYPFAADDQCLLRGGNSQPHPYCKYTPAPACTPAPATLTGTVTYIGQSTVCCL